MQERETSKIAARGLAKRGDDIESGDACTIPSSSSVSSTSKSTFTTIFRSTTASSASSISTSPSTTSSILPTLLTVGSLDHQCESVLQPESCLCICTVNEDCAPWDSYLDGVEYVSVCNTKIGLGCCECEYLGLGWLPKST